ncbi:hypothetical protein PC9H_009918 [Pleurotus ostreatus]|uniref:Uncharacterized protein n=1 Tax=Pleurotus ostreatus TaxID=5322 RepID=A0A8H6ZUN1_PLEOS|nr:uncharacterized protein PC9H_009918 [Pleurotus ostreatus]KAF7424610.1 hypothetical protein PC9H_009918 [Pleurotus ostreatus]KAJ8692420.1 hypothetical protein PTI98_009732 [Pleurotus ostreatus]
MDSSPYTHSSSNSEVDNLSDSDWLEISSNTGSSTDNDDSESDLDRDDELSSMPLSRRSSMSLGSSRDGEVDAWEGFVDDAGRIQTPSVLGVLAAPIDGELAAPVEEASVDRGQEDDEDLRVKAALDQSMVSTLSASRTSSSALHASTSTAHNSFNDLRLSFPDPLTSSRDELVRSYGDVLEEEDSRAVTDAKPDIVAESEEAVQPTLSEKQIIGRPEVVTSTQSILDRLNNTKFEIVLYGNSSDIKLSFVETLLQKIAAGGSWISLAYKDDRASRWFPVEEFTGDKYEHTSWIRVHDLTGDVTSPTTFSGHHPSLAIVYLPSLIPPELSRHTLYLPVFVPFPSLTDPVGSGELARRAAQDNWDLLDIPTSKVLRLKGKNSSILFDSDDIHDAEPRQVYLALQQLVKKPLSSGFSVALITILSLILGVIVHSVFRTSAPTPTIPTHLVVRPTGHLTIQTTNSPVGVTRAIATNHSTAIISSPIKDFAVAVVHPASTSLSVRRVATTSKLFKPAGKCSQSSTTGIAIRDAAEVMVRPSSAIAPVASTSALAVVTPLPGPSQPSVAPSAAKFVTTTVASSPSALSIRLATTLATIYGDAARAVVQAVSQDVKELMDALDALLQAIGDQTSVLVKKSKGKASVLREQLNYRNKRAKMKARELKDIGDRFVSYAGERLKERASRAKKRASQLRESWAKSEPIQACWKAHEGTTGRIVKELSKHSNSLKAVAKAHAASHEKIVKDIADRTKQRKRKARGLKRATSV